MLKNLKQAIKEKFVFDALAATALGMDKGNLSSMLKEDPSYFDRMRKARYEKINAVFSEYNMDWLAEKVGDDHKYREGVTQYTPSKSNGNTLGYLPDDEMQIFDEEGNTKFYEISPGVYRMKVPLMAETAKAGSLTGYADAEFIEDQEYIFTTVYKYHKGNYRAFKVIGDSMDVDRRVTFVHGDILIAREIKKDFWKSRFHTHKYPFYVFVTKSDGIIFKELTAHDVDGGIVKLHSLNEDKDTYPDFELSLDDVEYIFNVVKREVEI
ncbi:S24 family peptidase [Sphingobacterium zeae]|uniref:S24 family peptidase n=1 Tax=Sphingobacterium zeae TaxID=1776859 RepID=UPI00361A89AE